MSLEICNSTMWNTTAGGIPDLAEGVSSTAETISSRLTSVMAQIPFSESNFNPLNYLSVRECSASCLNTYDWNACLPKFGETFSVMQGTLGRACFTQLDSEASSCIEACSNTLDSNSGLWLLAKFSVTVVGTYLLVQCINRQLPAPQQETQQD